MLNTWTELWNTHSYLRQSYAVIAGQWVVPSPVHTSQHFLLVYLSSGNVPAPHSRRAIHRGLAFSVCLKFHVAAASGMWRTAAWVHRNGITVTERK
jgi:hypothetical protein